MHIAEGYLPIEQCILWFVISLIIVIYGVVKLREFKNENPESKPLLYISGAVMFILSFIRFPSVVGGSSHPTGNGFSGSLFGPAITSVLVAVMLLLQSLILGYGGITTLGANIFAIGVVGPFVAWVIYNNLSKMNIPLVIVLLLAGFFANIFTYLTTALQLAFAFPKPNFIVAFINFAAIFSVTQIPLAIIDAIIVVILWHVLKPISKLN